jgi:hypothetical protein
VLTSVNTSWQRASGPPCSTTATLRPSLTAASIPCRKPGHSSSRWTNGPLTLTVSGVASPATGGHAGTQPHENPACRQTARRQPRTASQLGPWRRLSGGKAGRMISFWAVREGTATGDRWQLRPREDAHRKRIPLRNDENHLCAGSERLPRVPVRRSAIGTVDGRQNTTAHQRARRPNTRDRASWIERVARRLGLTPASTLLSAGLGRTVAEWSKALPLFKPGLAENRSWVSRTLEHCRSNG